MALTEAGAVCELQLLVFSLLMLPLVAVLLYTHSDPLIVPGMLVAFLLAHFAARHLQYKTFA